MSKHGKNQNTEEIDFEAAQKGIEFDTQWQDSYDRAKEKEDEGTYPYNGPVTRR